MIVIVIEIGIAIGIDSMEFNSIQSNQPSELTLSIHPSIHPSFI